MNASHLWYDSSLLARRRQARGLVAPLQAPVATSSSEAAREMIESRLAWRGLRRVHSDSQVRDCVKAVLQRKPLRRFVCLHAFI